MNTAHAVSIAHPQVAAEKVVEDALKACQECLRQNPAIIVGSGASAAVGLPTMGTLANWLLSKIPDNTVSDEAQQIWTHFKSLLADKTGLEEAIDKSGLWQAQTLVTKVRKETWSCVCKADTNVFHQVVQDSTFLPMTRIFRHIFGSTHQTMKVITTNYDRLIEYAAEAGGYLCRTGFSPGYIGQWHGTTNVLEFRRQGRQSRSLTEKTVELWKVHGSLDWFKKDRRFFCIPCHWSEPNEAPTLGALINESDPLIVPPGQSKNAETQQDPYRATLHGADDVFDAAAAFLCIGYGFNDEHIQERLLAKARNERVPIIISTMQLTEKAKEIFLNTEDELKYHAFELSEHGTIMYSNSNRNGILLEGIDLWSLNGFADRVIG